MIQTVKNLPAIQETWVQSLGQEDALEKGMANHSGTLAWRIPWTEEPGRLQSWGCQESDMTEQLLLPSVPRLSLPRWEWDWLPPGLSAWHTLPLCITCGLLCILQNPAQYFPPPPEGESYTETKKKQRYSGRDRVSERDRERLSHAQYTVWTTHSYHPP